MNSHQRDELLVTTPPLKRYQVVFDDGSTWEGTKRELFAKNSGWWQFAKEIPQVVKPIPSEEMDFADDPGPTRLPSSARKYCMPDLQQGDTTYEFQKQTLKSPIHARRSAAVTEEQPAAPPRKRRRGMFRSHPFLLLGVGMLFMLALWVALSSLLNWWNIHQQDVTYGRPRTYQVDAVVGHNDSAANPSHFIFVNLNRRVLIIELPGGDSSKARIYNGPTLFGDGQDLTPAN